MASSFVEQIPTIVYLLQKLGPRSLLDVGKRFGKYGFLAHEYLGVDHRQLPDPNLGLAQMSKLKIDAVEAQPAYLFPYLEHIYSSVYVGKIENLYQTLTKYDVVLMADVIEHLEKQVAPTIVNHFHQSGSTVIVSTPKKFFEQHLFDSPYEEHISHWSPKDFGFAGFVDWQNCGSGRVFLLSSRKRVIRGFGSKPIARARRIARLLLAEFN